MSENNEFEKLFEGVVPERLDEILSLIEKHSAQFRRIGDRGGFNLDAGAYGAVQFTQRSLEQIWLFGFSCLQSLECYSSAITLAFCCSWKFDLEELEKIPEQKIEYNKFSEIIKSIEELNNSKSKEDFDWPTSVPNPENGKPEEIKLAAMFDLIMMASAYIFLHELRHVIFQSENNTPQDPHEEEMQCDSFASNMMLSKIDEYCKGNNYPEDKVRMKRSMGIALGSAFLAVATPKHNLNGTATHPPVYKRWSAAVGEINLAEDDYHWLYFSSLAIALIKYKEIDFPPQAVTSYKQLAISSIKAFENGTNKL